MEDLGRFLPECVPTEPVWPVRRDVRGVEGPTPGEARGPYWRRSAWGWYVPADVDAAPPEQRIVEQGVRIIGAARGAVTGWAALRWQGAAYFDGRSARGGLRPVELIRSSGGSPARSGGAVLSSAQLAPYDAHVIRGLRVTTPTRALFDEVRVLAELRAAVVAMDMTAAAGLLNLDEMDTYLTPHRNAWTGVPLARKAVALASDRSRSPRETRLRLVWMLDAGLPRPLVNQPVFDPDGRLLGIPDLLDPRTGLVGEYDGADHRRGDRRARDVVRAELFRDHGLEVVTVVTGQLRHRGDVVARLLEGQRRAARVRPGDRRWTIDPPMWWSAGSSLG